MFFSKTNHVIEQLNSHSGAVIDCYKQYIIIFEEIVKKQSINDFSEDYALSLVTKMKELEENADDMRHKAIVELLQGGLLVDSRKSSMRLVAGLDLVADTTEDIIQMIIYEQMIIVDWIHNPLLKINQITLKQLNGFIEVLAQMVTKYNMESIMSQIKQIKDLESEVDYIEDQLIKELYSSKLDLPTKHHYKELIRLISSMSDVIEDLSDEVEIILASRRI